MYQPGSQFKVNDRASPPYFDSNTVWRPFLINLTDSKVMLNFSQCSFRVFGKTSILIFALPSSKTSPTLYSASFRCAVSVIKGPMVIEVLPFCTAFFISAPVSVSLSVPM